MVYDKNIQGGEIYCGSCLIDNICELSFMVDRRGFEFKRDLFDYIRESYYIDGKGGDQLKIFLYHSGTFYWYAREDEPFRD